MPSVFCGADARITSQKMPPILVGAYSDPLCTAKCYLYIYYSKFFLKSQPQKEMPPYERHLFSRLYSLYVHLRYFLLGANGNDDEQEDRDRKGYQNGCKPEWLTGNLPTNCHGSTTNHGCNATPFCNLAGANNTGE